jgi:hypothetical protein
MWGAFGEAQTGIETEWSILPWPEHFISPEDRHLRDWLAPIRLPPQHQGHKHIVIVSARPAGLAASLTTAHWALIILVMEA